MAYYFTSADLISSVKRRANIPDAQAMVTDAEILAYANEEMLLNLVPLVVSKHEDYYLIEEPVSVVSTQKEYPIPYRALGSKIRELAFKREDETYVELHRVSVDRITDQNYRYYGDYTSNRFYIKNESVVIDATSTIDNYNTLAFFYNIRPNQLVDSDRVAVITSIDTATGTVAVDSIPENITASSKIDFVKLNAPHRILDYDVTPTTLDTSNNFFTFDTSDLPTGLAVGDRICLQNETDLVNAPSELHSMLAEMVAARVLESIGDTEGLSAANNKLARMEKSTEYLIDNRVTGSPIKCSPRNGLLKGRRNTRRRW